MSKLNQQAIGSTVNLRRSNGSKYEFIVVHHGLPSAMYDSSCNGTWLFLKNTLGTTSWDGTDNDYANSFIHSKLNGSSFMGNLASDIQRSILTVKIPYWQGTGTGGSLASGVSGLECKAFLPAYNEMVADPTHFLPVDGSQLQYFAAANLTDYSEHETWLRSPHTSSNNEAGEMHSYASVWDVSATTRPHRPMVIMPGDCEVSSDGYVQPSITANGAVTIGGEKKQLSGAHAKIGGAWKEIAKTYTNIGGVWKPSK